MRSSEIGFGHGAGGRRSTGPDCSCRKREGGPSELEQFAACRSKEILGRLKRHDFTGEICAAIFEHDASRALDPQLHTHCVVANATWDKNRGRWSALTEYEMVHAIRYAGKVYQNDLAIRLKALGYRVVEEHDKRGNVIGWEIEGVSKEVRHEFSRRRREIDSGIEAFRAQYGRAPSSSEIGVITRATREGNSTRATLKPRKRSALHSWPGSKRRI